MNGDLELDDWGDPKAADTLGDVTLKVPKIDPPLCAVCVAAPSVAVIRTDRSLPVCRACGERAQVVAAQLGVDIEVEEF